MSKRQRRKERMANAVALSPDIRISNAWLVTGRDTMPEERRGLLHSLLSYWGLVRRGLHKVARGKWRHIDRAAWLELDDAKRFTITLGVYYDREKIQRLLYADSPFLALLPKRRSFAEVSA